MLSDLTRKLKSFLNKSKADDGPLVTMDTLRRNRILKAAAHARARGLNPADDPRYTGIVEEERRRDPSYRPETLGHLKRDGKQWEPTPEHLSHMEKLQDQMVVDANDREGKQYNTAEYRAMADAARSPDPATGYTPDSEPVSGIDEYIGRTAPDELLGDHDHVARESDTGWFTLQDIPVDSDPVQEDISEDS